MRESEGYGGKVLLTVLLLLQALFLCGISGRGNAVEYRFLRAAVVQAEPGLLFWQEGIVDGGNAEKIGEKSSAAVMEKDRLSPGIYREEPGKKESYCYITISDVTPSTFDFAVYRVDRYRESRVFGTATARVTGDGGIAVMDGNICRITFKRSEEQNGRQAVTELQLEGYEPVRETRFVKQEIF